MERARPALRPALRPTLRLALWLVTWLALWLESAECTHIFTLDKDFSKLKADPGLAKHAGPVLKRLKTFRVAVHPRIRLFYHLLKRTMVEYAHRTGDSLYSPYVYREPAQPARRGARTVAGTLANND